VNHEALPLERQDLPPNEAVADFRVLVDQISDDGTDHPHRPMMAIIAAAGHTASISHPAACEQHAHTSATRVEPIASATDLVAVNAPLFV
jgi:hypothetical protein